MPALRAFSTKRRKSGTSKKNWEMARVAPASNLRFRLSRSASGDEGFGMGLGKGRDADLEIGDALQAGDQVRGIAHAAGIGFEALAARRRIAADAPRYGACRQPNNAAASASISARVAPTQVIWAAGVRLVSRRMRMSVSQVAAGGAARAPQVQETKRGDSGSSRFSVCQNCSPASGLRGGKNSKETTTSRMRRAEARRLEDHARLPLDSRQGTVGKPGRRRRWPSAERRASQIETVSALPLRWRTRAGFSPASLSQPVNLAVCRSPGGDGHAPGEAPRPHAGQNRR